MATRQNGAGSILRRTRREESSPYKRRNTRNSPPIPKLQSSSSLSSLFSFLSFPFRRKSSHSVPLPPQTAVDSDHSAHSDDDGSTDVEQQALEEPTFGAPRRDDTAADSLSRLGHSLQQCIPKPKILPPSSILPPADPDIKPSASTSQIAPLNRPRRSVQPAFATISRAAAKRTPRPSFPGGNGSYGGFASTVEPSPPPFTPGNPLETSFAANRPPNTKPSSFSFTTKPTLETHNPPGKTSSEVLAEFFAAKGKAPLTPEERKKVAQLIAESDAEQSPDVDPYNGVPSFSFLKASFPAPQRNSLSSSNSLAAPDSAAPASTGLAFNLSGPSVRDVNRALGSGPGSGAPVAPRRRRPINYGGSTKRSTAATKAGFTLREHQKLLEKQKTRQQAMAENVAPDPSAVGDKRGMRDSEEDGGGKKRRTNDGQGAPVSTHEPAKSADAPASGVARVFSLSAQPNMPSPLRQMTKLNSPSPPRVVLRAQAPSPSSSLSRPASEDIIKSPPTAKPAAKSKPRSSLVADVMRDMLAEDKEREKKEQAKEKVVDQSVFSNPYEDAILQPVITAPKVRKPRRQSARPAAKSSATTAKQETEKPLSLIEKIEKTDVRPNVKKVKTESAAPAPPPVKTTIQPPTFTFTAPSPKDTTPKARRPPPIVEEPSAPIPVESDEIEIIEVDETPQPESKQSTTGRPSLSLEVNHHKPPPAQNGTSTGMLGLPRQRPSFSLHSPARPSPLREMSVPIEDEEDEIMEIPAPEKAGSGFGGFGSNAFSFGSGMFSAPVPPPAPTLSHAQLPAKKEPVKIDAPLFSAKAEPVKVEKVEVPKAEPPTPVPETKPAPVFFPPPPKVTSSLPFAAPEPKPKPVAPMSEAELKNSAQSIPVSALPVFSFTAPVLASKAPKTLEACSAAQLPVSKLPTFTFGASSSTAAPVTKTASFDWAAAGMKPPTTASGSQWTCEICMLSNPASAADKCTICEAPKPGAVAAAPTPALAPAPAPVTKTASFDWAAAGMKPPTTASGSQWTCGMCMLSNPASATDKCAICEAPKPGAAAAVPAPASTPAPAPVTKTASFDWAAAGMKAPTTASGSQWTCGVCMLSNPASATDKCTICEAPKSGAASVAAPAPTPAPAPVAKTMSFDWAAAGMKPPTVSGWKCSLCGVSNKDAASKCVACETAR